MRRIYAYQTPGAKVQKWTNARTDHPNAVGVIKIGETERENVEERIVEQLRRTANPTGDRHETLMVEPAARADGRTRFSDKDIHRELRRAGVGRAHGEWYEATIGEVRRAYDAVRVGVPLSLKYATYELRAEQRDAIDRTMERWTGSEHTSPGPRRFLWNAKMRFGKCFAALMLAKEMNARSVLILTYMPAVENAWRDEVLQHEAFKFWQFHANHDTAAAPVRDGGTLVRLCSMQGLDDNRSERRNARRRALRATPWDLLISSTSSTGVPTRRRAARRSRT